MKRCLSRFLFLAFIVSIFTHAAFALVPSRIHLNSAVPQPNTRLYPDLEIARDAYDISILYGAEEDRVSIDFYFTRDFDRNSFAKIHRLNGQPIGTYTRFADALSLVAHIPNGAEYPVDCSMLSENLRKVSCAFNMPIEHRPELNNDFIPSESFVINVYGQQQVEDTEHNIGPAMLQLPTLDLKDATPLFLTTVEEYGAPDADNDGVFDDIDRCADQSEVYASDGSIVDGIEDGCPNSSHNQNAGANGDGSGEELTGDGTDDEEGLFCTFNPRAKVNFSGIVLMVMGVLPLFLKRRHSPSL